MFKPIESTRTDAVSIGELRRQIDGLAGLTRDYCAYTEHERKSDAFQNFMKQLESKTREVASLYCKRSNRQDDYKAMTLDSANKLLAYHWHGKRHLQIVQ